MDIKNKNDKAFPKEVLPTAWIADEFSGDIQYINDEGAYTYSEDNMAIDQKDNYHDYKTDDNNKAKKQSKKSDIVDISVENTKM